MEGVSETAKFIIQCGALGLLAIVVGIGMFYGGKMLTRFFDNLTGGLNRINGSLTKLDDTTRSMHNSMRDLAQQQLEETRSIGIRLDSQTTLLTRQQEQIRQEIRDLGR